MMENIESQDIKNIEWTSLPNEILINIFDYLTKGDLQQVRLVCQSWRVVTHSPALCKKFKLVINPNNLKPIYEDLSKDKDLSQRLAYATLELHGVEASPKLCVVLKSLNQHVRSLFVKNSPVLGMLNECFPELEELKMAEFEDVVKEEMLLLNLKQFKNFKSLEVANDAMLKFTTFYLLRSLINNPPFKMEKLYFGFEEIAVHEKFGVNAVKYHSNSLKHLSISLRITPTNYFHHQWEEVFPLLKNLESIKLVGSTSYKFLKNLVLGLPKEAPLRSFQLTGVLLLDNVLLKILIDKWPKSLESINVHYGQYITSNVFQNTTKLRRCLKHLTLTSNMNLDVNSLVEGLPAETLESLTLMNNGSGCSPFSVNPVALSRPKRPKITLNNRTLQIICQNQRKLRRLALNECHNVSDKGLIGFEEMQAPISNLRGLQDLSLSGGENITDRSLVEALKFNELSKLRLDSLEKITSAGIKELVKNCPALERVWISSCRMIDDDAVLYIVRGLKRLRYLNVSECQLITNTSLDHVAVYGQYLKLVHISGTEQMESSKNRALIDLLNPVDIYTTSDWQ